MALAAASLVAAVTPTLSEIALIKTPGQLGVAWTLTLELAFYGLVTAALACGLSLWAAVGAIVVGVALRVMPPVMLEFCLGAFVAHYVAIRLWLALRFASGPP